jgi:hypothetical protein
MCRSTALGSEGTAREDEAFWRSLPSAWEYRGGSSWDSGRETTEMPCPRAGRHLCRISIYMRGVRGEGTHQRTAPDASQALLACRHHARACHGRRGLQSRLRICFSMSVLRHQRRLNALRDGRRGLQLTCICRQGGKAPPPPGNGIARAAPWLRQKKGVDVFSRQRGRLLL